MKGIIIENIANLYQVATNVPKEARNRWGRCRKNL